MMDIIYYKSYYIYFIIIYIFNIMFHRQAPPQVLKHLKWFFVVNATSVEDVVNRLLDLLKNMTGINYHYEYYKFGIWVTNYRGIQSCQINIYLNSGEYQKSQFTCLNTSEIISDENRVQQFAVEFDDITRYFTALFRYIEKNFSVDIIEPFSDNDLNYGLYCPSYTNESEMDIKQTKRRRITMSRRTRRRMRRNRKARKNRF